MFVSEVKAYRGMDACSSRLIFFGVQLTLKAAKKEALNVLMPVTEGHHALKNTSYASALEVIFIPAIAKSYVLQKTRIHRYLAYFLL